MSLLIKNNNKKLSSSLPTIGSTKTTTAKAADACTRAIKLHKNPTIKSTAAARNSSSIPLLSPSVEATSSNVDVVSSSASSSLAISLFSMMEQQPIELTQVTTAAAPGSGRKVFRTMPSFKIMSNQNIIALLTVLVCGLVTVNGLKCYMCGQYNEGVGSITPCLNYSEQYAHLYLKECSKKSEKYCVKLLCLLNVSHKKAQTGRPGLELKNILFMTLWKLSNRNSFREVSDRFNVGMGACYRGFVDCVQLIANQKQLIKFPNSESSRRKIMEGFESFRSHPFPYVLGCIDGTHIRISQPSNDSISYYNRKGTYSIIVQKYVSELSIVRDCATECAEKEIWETQTYCCTEDGCNGSTTIEASAVVVILPLVIYLVNEIMNIMKQQRR